MGIAHRDAKSAKLCEPAKRAPSKLSLVWARVALGRCKDFGGRCASSRRIGEPITSREWPKKGGDHWVRPPPRLEAPHSRRLYDSVSGTEGDLQWVAHLSCATPAGLWKAVRRVREVAGVPELVIQLEKRTGAADQCADRQVASKAQSRLQALLRDMDCSSELPYDSRWRQLFSRLRCRNQRSMKAVAWRKPALLSCCALHQILTA